MRVTNSMLVSNFLTDLSGNMNRVSSLQRQMSSGRKFDSISDDPVSLLYSLQARNKLSRLGQYQNNASMVSTWLRNGETSVMEMNQTIVTAYEEVINTATDVKNDSDRQKVAAYVKQLRDHIVTIGNTTIGDKFIFGSYNTTGSTPPPGPARDAPFTVDEATGHLFYNGLDMTDTSAANILALQGEQDQTLEFWIGTNLKMDTTISGIDLMGLGDENTYKILDDLYNALNTPGSSAEDISPFISKLQKKQGDLLALAAEYGGRANRVDMIQSRYEQDEISYIMQKSDAEDVDLAEAIMNYSMAKSVYDAALSAGAKIIQNTLLDFLR